MEGMEVVDCLEEEMTLDEQEDNKITEGKAKIYSPKNVFYNPVQEFNRDLSIAVTTKVVSSMVNQNGNSNHEKEPNKDSKESTERSQSTEKSKPIRILEALAATGLRSMRFALEIPFVSEIVANDFDKKAVEYIRRNAEANGVTHIVKPSFADATQYMHDNRALSDRFQVIDLDPYGSPSRFLNGAVQSIADGGLLSVTCTDMAVLCGNSPDTCLIKYGSVSLKSRFCHEMSLRILLRSIESHANLYSRYIVPVLSISVDFYCRVFVKVFTSQQIAKQSASRLSYVHRCTGCGIFRLQKLCEKVKTGKDTFMFIPSNSPITGNCGNCSGRFVTGGPIWSEPIHDRLFVDELLKEVTEKKDSFKTSERMIGMLTVISEELEEHPLYYDADNMCSILHTTSLGFLPMRSALLNGGYQVSLSHAAKNSVKTDAPPEVVWDIMRCWVKKNPVREDRRKEGSVASHILDQEINFEADFTIHPLANPASRRKGLLRWQINPEKDWGPKPRAGREEKSLQKKRKAEEAKKEAKKSRILEDTRKFPCQRFRNGCCEYGDDCVYNHAAEPLSIDVDNLNNGSITVES